MKKGKRPLLFGLIFFVLYRLISYWSGEPLLSLLIFTIPFGILFFNFLVRKKLKFKPWFLSVFNFFLDKSESISHSDIYPELLYEKLVEVIVDSDFNLADKNETKKEILATTSANFWTWGENIYIEIIQENEGSKIIITSTTIYGTSSWNRNEKNFEDFYHSFEQSLTI